MSKKNIIIAIAGGAIVGGLGVASMIYPSNAALLVSCSAIVATVVATITGLQIKGS